MCREFCSAAAGSAEGIARGSPFHFFGAFTRLFPRQFFWSYQMRIRPGEFDARYMERILGLACCHDAGIV